MKAVRNPPADQPVPLAMLFRTITRAGFENLVEQMLELHGKVRSLRTIDDTRCEMGVEFEDVNVLADDAIRQGIKDFSDWPTIPQLYVKGEFVGGCDIITEMTLSGELDQLFDDKGVGYNKDAANQIREHNS